MCFRRQYPTNLTNRQWNRLQRMLPKPKRRGRRPIDRRRILDAIRYQNRTGCQWRMLPREFPNWSTVYGVFRQWVNQGVWKRIHDKLRVKVRKAAGKKPQPTAAIVDSQSVRSACGGEQRGYDGGKKITGRKRHLAVDTLGLVLEVVVYGADWQDSDGGAMVLIRLRESFRRLQVAFADSAYGQNGLPEWVRSVCGFLLQTVLRPVGVKGFVVLPKRWIVERTFAWLGHYRRHSKDYEKTTASSESMIYISMIDIMLKRLDKTAN